MNKIIIIVIAAGLMVGVGFLIWKGTGNTPAPTSATQTTPGSTFYPGQTTVTVSNPTQTGASTSSQTQTPNQSQNIQTLDQAYANLLLQLQAQSIPFSGVDSASGNLGSIYKLYTADITTSKKTFPNDTNFSLHMASLDLNEDGVAEVLVYEDLPGFCGTGGCPLDIYQKKGGSWTKIFNHLILGEPALSNTVTSGYFDLFMSIQVSGYESNVMRYTWDGTTYREQRATALWDGTQFDLLP